MSTLKIIHWIGKVTQELEPLPSKCEALSSTARTSKKKNYLDQFNFKNSFIY
jgi:hypothetical protein